MIGSDHTGQKEKADAKQKPLETAGPDFDESEVARLLVVSGAEQSENEVTDRNQRESDPRLAQGDVIRRLLAPERKIDERDKISDEDPSHGSDGLVVGLERARG